MAQRHYTGLDLLRLGAALVIVFYHYCSELYFYGFFTERQVDIAAGLTEAAINVFFLLSGAALMLRYGADGAGQDWRRYYQKRIAAIYPMYWLGFGVLFLYSDVLHRAPDGPAWWRVVFSLLGLDGYLAQFTPTFYKIGEWFLGCLLLCYLLFPLLVGLLHAAARRRWLWAPIAAAGAAILALAPAPLARAGVQYGHTLLWRLPVFVLGMALGPRLAQKRFSLTVGSACALIWLLLPGRFPREYSSILLAAALLLLVGALPAGPAGWQRALRWLAGQCYGVFLVHHVLLNLAFVPLLRRCPAAWLWPVFAVYVPASFALAWCLRQAARPLAWLLQKALARGA